MTDTSPTTRIGGLRYRPRFEIAPALLGRVEAVAALRGWIQGDGLAISKQGAMDLIRPLVKAKLVKRVGTLKNGRYVLR